MDDPSGEELVSVEVAGGVGIVQLRRPVVLNALNPPMLEQLDEAITSLSSHDVRVVVITGEGKAFCTGADLTSLLATQKSDPDHIVQFVADIRRVFGRIARLPMPVIAAVNGPAYAGGLELVLACDIVIAAHDAPICDAHARSGFLPGAGAGSRLPRIVGENVAKYLLFTSQPMSAQSLVPCGLVNETVPGELLDSRVRNLARQIASFDPGTLISLKRLVDEGLATTLRDAEVLEAVAHAAQVRTDEFQQGLIAFARGRPVHERGGCREG